MDRQTGAGDTRFPSYADGGIDMAAQLKLNSRHRRPLQGAPYPAEAWAAGVEDKSSLHTTPWPPRHACDFFVSRRCRCACCPSMHSMARNPCRLAN